MMAVEQLAMSAGWAAAVIALVAAGLLRVRLIRRVALVAEAAHELRGPLTAAGLALHGAGGDPGRLAAAELELRRAGLALDDLVGAPRGRRATATLQHVDVRAVAGEVVAATRPMAARFGAMVRLEVPPWPGGCARRPATPGAGAGEPRGERGGARRRRRARARHAHGAARADRGP